MDETVPLVLAAALTFVFGWNNSSILIGNESGSGTLSAREATILCAIGMFLGVALEGSQMRGSLGAMVVGHSTESMVLATLVVSILLTLFLTAAAIPVSFSNTMVGAFAGAALASSFGIRAAHLETTILFWAVAPLVTALVSIVCYSAIERGISSLSLVALDNFNRAGVGLVSIALAFVLSANNIGLIYGTAFSTSSAGGSPLPTVLVLAAFAMVAVALFGRGSVAGTVGDRLVSLTPQGVLAAFVGTIAVMWAATMLAIPISVSQCLLGGMFGAALTKRIGLVNERLSLEVATSWVLVPLCAFFIAWLALPVV